MINTEQYNNIANPSLSQRIENFLSKEDKYFNEGLELFKETIILIVSSQTTNPFFETMIKNKERLVAALIQINPKLKEQIEGIETDIVANYFRQSLPKKTDSAAVQKSNHSSDEIDSLAELVGTYRHP